MYRTSPLYIILLFTFCYLLQPIRLQAQSAKQQQETTTFILVRHAEKVDDGTTDPPLSNEGRERATRLAEHLKETRLTAIYSTPYRRTRQTAEPISAQKDLRIKEYEPFSPNTLQNILAEERGGKVLIVGHSNTTPLFVNRLIGAELYAELEESDYENLFIVTVTDMEKGTVLHLTY